MAHRWHGRVAIEQARRVTVDVIGCTYTQCHGVKSKVGKLGVAVGVVRNVESEVDVDMARRYPSHIHVKTDVCRHARTYQLVVGIRFGIVRIPPEGESEIPLVVERKPVAKARYAHSLQHKYRHGIAQLWVELVPSDAHSLIGITINACLLAVLGGGEGILQVIAHIVVHGANFGVHATQKVVGVKNCTRTIVEHQLMYEVTGG